MIALPTKPKKQGADMQQVVSKSNAKYTINANPVLYRTYPRIVLINTALFIALFSAYLAHMAWVSAKDNYNLVTIGGLMLFSLIAIAAFCSLFTLEIVLVT